MKTDQQHVPLSKYIYAGLIAGVSSAFVNNIYNVIFSSVTSFSLPGVINPLSITLASILPLIIASLFYFGLKRFTIKADILFSAATVLLTLLSLGGPLGSQLPDGTLVPPGFAALTIPMHVIAAVSAALIIPRFVKR